jgi:hypothetical protein
MKQPLETSLAYKYFVAYRLYDGQRFDEVVIPYRPRHSFQKKIRRFIHDSRWLPYFFFALCLGTYFLTHNGWPVACMIMAAAAAWSYIETNVSVQPTHFGLSNKGLRLYWIRWFGDKSSGYIPWANISHVRIRKVKEFVFDEAYLDFMSAKDTGQSVFSLRLDGIVTGEQRKRLHTAIKQHLKTEQIAWELHDILNPVKADGYTQLWLEVLATTPQRNRQEVLPKHVVVANDRYEIVGQIGSGGQGIAYLGRSRLGALGKDSPPLDVVLKEFVLPYHAGLSVSKKALDQLQREADLLKQIAHPQIVKMIDLFVEDQRAYLVLQHIEGDSLRRLVDERGPFSEDQVISLGIQMCDILTHLHKQQPPVLHRDFTPENLIMGVDGYLKLIDFNVAQQMHSNATRTVVGKHSYIPPEQFRGKATTQSDVYAMGASLYFLLTGQEPEPIATAHPRNLNANLSAELDSIVAQATAIDTDVRFACAEAVKNELTKLETKNKEQSAYST